VLVHLVETRPSNVWAFGAFLQAFGIATLVRRVLGLVVLHRFDIEFVLVEEILISRSYEPLPVVLHLALVGRPLLEGQVPVLEHVLVHHVRNPEGRPVVDLLLELLANCHQLFSIRRLLYSDSVFVEAGRMRIFAIIV